MSEVVGERGVGRAEVRVGRWARKKREKREMEREVVVVVGEEGSIFFCWGFGFRDGGWMVCW